MYVGKALNLKNRIASHLSERLTKSANFVSQSTSITCIETPSELEALLLEAHLIKTHQSIFNTRAKDDKHPLYIKITVKDKYPRVFTVRRENELNAVYFGPFPSSSIVKQVLKFLRTIFPFDTQKTIGKKPCFWSHLGLCHPCPSFIDKLPPEPKRQARTEYLKNISGLVNVLFRKTDQVINSFKKEMDKSASSENFEEAAKIRDQLTRLEYITKEYHSVSAFLENPNLSIDIHKQEMKALRFILSTFYHLSSTFARTECYDASHTATTNPTVGMATFINGEPEKNLYRRFRIRDKVIKDDLSFLEEALRRRFKHQEWKLPELIVIDGGKLQTKRAQEVIRELKLKIPVVGLVKPFDNLVIPYKDGFLIKKVNNPPALSLLQRLRDEAHRFARSYHQKLRSKSFLNSYSP